MRLNGSYPPATRGKLVVWGLMGSHPFGGMIWQVLHYVVGLRRLGFDVWYVEDSDRLVYDPLTYSQTFDCDANIELLAKHMESVCLSDRWIFRRPGSKNSCEGATDISGLSRLYEEADAVINLCGSQELLPQHDRISHLVYIQTDPVADQVELATGNEYMIQELGRYKHLFTYGENLGASDCLVPIEHYSWIPTRPPVCLDWWISEPPVLPRKMMTTIAHLKHSGKDVEWAGEVWHWSKDREFSRFVTLPSRSSLSLEIAVGLCDEEDEKKLRDNGWQIVSSDPLADPDAYRRYICTSLGEFTVAKGLYVQPRTGWFSDRSVCYLAAGRPVITQDTGFGKFIPTGNGLFAFTTAEEALVAMDVVSSNYAAHSRAAREIAGECFDAKRVLEKAMQKVGLL